jgi:hypothetical protein
MGALVRAQRRELHLNQGLAFDDAAVSAPTWNSEILFAQPIFCEILDTRTQQLIESHPTLGDACHFLVSNRMTSKVIVASFFSSRPVD